MPLSQRPRRLDLPSADRLLVVLSDIEMGPGGLMDDFPHSDFLAELIEAYNAPEFADIDVDLVLNGDTFDFLKTPVAGNYPRHVTAKIALEKLETVAKAHPKFFEGLRGFLEHEGAQRKVWFIVGNHDPELVFPQVRRAIRDLVGVAPDRIAFPGLAMEVGEVRIEHGNQRDRMFQVDPKKPFLDHKGELILNLPWGAVALLDVAMPLKQYMYFLDRCKPRKRVIDLLPEVKDLLVGAFWKYWTRDYWLDYLYSSDPVKRLTWTMFREVVYRFGTNDMNIPPNDAYLQELRKDDRHRLLVLGHTHEPGWVSHIDRKLLRTGCFRNEWSVGVDGTLLRLIPKVYAEVYMRSGQLLRSHLVELDGPPPPAGSVFDSVYDVLPMVRPLLGTATERAEIEAAQARQEALEAREKEQVAVKEPVD